MSRLNTMAGFLAARRPKAHREWLISEIESGDMHLSELREEEDHDSRVATIKVMSIAEAVPGVGKAQARQAMNELGIPADARWGELASTTESALWQALKRPVVSNI